MIVSRRHFLRLLRVRNLLACTVLLIVLYTLKVIQSSQLEVQVERTDEIPNKADNLVKSTDGLDVFVPRNFNRIDWHNWAQIKAEELRKGVGEQGKPAFLTSTHQDEASLYAENGFNAPLSDAIGLNRSLPDIRHHGCRTKKYIADLPTVSVVVPFHNEHWSTLLRTAHSVLHRSPEHLIKEVFLVDDASTKEFLGSKLDKYLSEHMPKVKVVRIAKRSGLITARLAGAKLATGDVLIFLDSHTEANVNWLPPLLEPIALNYKTAVCPFIDVVAFDTFEYRAQDEGARGAFDWQFFYKRLPILPKDEENMPEPFESPVMAGGLFAISRKFFWELGGYDPGLDIWGGEQYELSFKIWQCGGRMLDAPCSRVGHIYRKFAPFPNPGHGDFVGKNYRRVAEVWMDEYAQYLYKRRPHYLKIDPGDLTEQWAVRNRLKCKSFKWFMTQAISEVWMDEYDQYLYMRRPHYLEIDPGDLTEQWAVRNRLKCKSFKWFMTQVAFDLTAKYPVEEPSPFAQGKVRSEVGDLCVDALNVHSEGALRLRECAKHGTTNAEQEFQLSWHKDMRCQGRPMCWDVPESKAGSPVLLYSCHLGGGNQAWKYLLETKQLRHSSGSCLDHDPDKMKLFVNPCSEFRHTQKWIMQYDGVAMSRWDQINQRVTGPVDYDAPLAGPNVYRSYLETVKRQQQHRYIVPVVF